MGEVVYIYGLREEGSNELRYVGKTKDIHERFMQHLRQGDDIHSGKNQWITACKTHGITINQVILEECTIANSDERESHWINFYRGNGHRLTNYFRPAPDADVVKSIDDGLGFPRMGRMSEGGAFTNEDIVEYLGLLSQKLGSQKLLAQKIGINQAYLSDILAERRDPADKILTALGMERVVTYRFVNTARTGERAEKE